MAQINKPDEYFNTVLYTGNGSTQSITGVGFQPDWVWIKRRTPTGGYHNVFDVVRGATKRIFPNDIGVEQTTSNSLTSFDSDGFSLGSNGDVNDTSASQVAWNWLADNTSGSSNTDGSITSTVSANTTSGFSIVSYTGTGANATVGHGLDDAPKMYICKSRSGARSWAVYNENIGNTKALFLNTSDAQDTDATYWNSTSPTNSVVSLGSRSEMNHSGENFVMYCFAEKKGFSKFGSYVGNGNADGTFIYTGFRPAFVMVKQTNSSPSWTILDNKRDSFNVTEKRLFPDSNDADTVGANGNTDFLSNGVKMRTSHAGINASGGSYIYMAFAESPLVGTNNTPATAR